MIAKIWSARCDIESSDIKNDTDDALKRENELNAQVESLKERTYEAIDAEKSHYAAIMWTGTAVGIVGIGSVVAGAVLIGTKDTDLRVKVNVGDIKGEEEKKLPIADSHEIKALRPSRRRHRRHGHRCHHGGARRLSLQAHHQLKPRHRHLVQCLTGIARSRRHFLTHSIHCIFSSTEKYFEKKPSHFFFDAMIRMNGNNGVALFDNGAKYETFTVFLYSFHHPISHFGAHRLRRRSFRRRYRLPVRHHKPLFESTERIAYDAPIQRQ